MPVRKILSENIRHLLAAQKTTQMEVAKKGGITQASVSLASIGKKDIRMDTLEGIAKGFGVSPQSLLSPSPGDDEAVREIVDLFLQLPPESRREVLRTARNELRYIKRV